MGHHGNAEELYQKVYDLERALNVSETMKDSLQQDIEALQIQLNTNETNFQEYKKRIEAELTNKWMDKVNSLRSELDEEKITSRNVILDLKNKISSLEHQDLTVTDKLEDENLKEELIKKDGEIDNLTKQVHELNTMLETTVQEQSNLNLRLKSLEETHEQTLEMLSNKKDSLFQAMEALKDIQEEKALLSNELSALKAGPVDVGRRGNSLFAEVDDNRQILMKNISLLKNKLSDSNIKLSNKNAEIISLKKENDRLHQEIQDLDKVIKPEQIKLVEAYKGRISELQLLVKKLENQEPSQNSQSTEPQSLQWAYYSLEKTKSELREFQKQYNTVSQQKLEAVENLSVAEQELKTLKAELASEKKLYKLKIQEAEEKLKSRNTANNEISDRDNNKKNGEVDLQNTKQGKGVRFATEF